ncbi:MAG: hypothetical protein ACK4RK_19695 [Gemmataceae bacterium]
MAKKNINFDFKQFFLQKGERLALGIAVVVMALLLVFGTLNAAGSDNPLEIAQKIRAKATQVVTWVEHAGPIQPTPPDVPRPLLAPVENEYVDPNQFPCPAVAFVPGTQEDEFRRNPIVLGPVEYQLELIRDIVRFFDVEVRQDNLLLGVLEPKDSKPAPPPPQNVATQKTPAQLYRERYIALVMQARLQQLMKNPQTAAAIMQMTGQRDSSLEKYTLRYVPPDQVPPNAKFAEVMQPTRLVVVTASFPYMEQLEAFRKALRLPSIQALINEKEGLPQFLGMEVQRRAFDGKGNLREDWAPLDTKNDVQWATYRFILSRASGFEKDPDTLKPLVVNKQLFLPRPQLATQTYSDIQLPSIRRVMDELAKKGSASDSLLTSPLSRRLSGEDPFSVLDDDTNRMTTPAASGAQEDKNYIPDYCLMRFLDVTVQPGYTYEYRLRIRLANPNYGKRDLVAYPQLAAEKELVGPEGWWTGGDNPMRVSVSDEQFYYVADDSGSPPGKPDQTKLQVHRWLETERLDPNNAFTAIPIGCWIVGDINVYRGDFMNERENVELPMWFPNRESFGLATPAVSARPTFPFRPMQTKPGVPVAFHTNDLLVDFEGGKKRDYTVRSAENKVGRRILDDSSQELLILTADGKLVVRSSHIDQDDPARQERLNLYQSRVARARSGGAGGTGTGGGSNPNDPFAIPSR